MLADKIIVGKLVNRDDIWFGPAGGYWSNLEKEEPAYRPVEGSRRNSPRVALCHPAGECGDYRQLADMQEEDGNDFFDELPKSGAKKAVERYFPQYFDMIFSPKRAGGLPLLDPKPGEIVLDVGCMWGALTIPIARAGCNVVAIDQTLESLLILKQRILDEKISNIEIVHADLKKIRYEDSSIDKFVVNGVLEWIPGTGTKDLEGYYGRRLFKKDCCTIEPGRVQNDFLRGIYTGLKKDGMLYLAIENRFDIFNFVGFPDPHCNVKFITFMPRRMQNIISTIALGRPYLNWTYSAPALREMLIDAGFKDIRIFYAFPDYRFPEYILTEKGMKYFRPNFYKMRETFAAKVICYAVEYMVFRRLRLKFFSPSFIVVARK